MTKKEARTLQINGWLNKSFTSQMKMPQLPRRSDGQPLAHWEPHSVETPAGDTNSDERITLNGLEHTESNRPTLFEPHKK